MDSDNTSQEQEQEMAFGEDIQGAFDSWFEKSPEERNAQLNNPNHQDAAENPVSQVTEKPVEEKHEIQISDDPFADILEEKAPEETAEAEPDFEKEINEKYKEEPGDAKGKARWGELKSDLKKERLSKYQLERSNAELKAKLQEREANPQVSDEYKEKYEKLLNSHAVVALEHNQEFQEKIAQPYMKAKNYVDSAISHFGINVEALEKALNVTNEFQRNRELSQVFSDAKEDMLPEERATLVQALAAESAYGAKYKEGYDKAQELYAAQKQKEQEAQGKSYEQRRGQLLEAEADVFERLNKNPDFKSIFNGSANDLRDKVKKSLEVEADPKIAVFEKISSFAYKPLMATIGEKNKKIAELEATLEKYVRGGMSAGEGATAPAVAEKKVDQFKNAGDDFASALVEAHGGRTHWTGGRM